MKLRITVCTTIAVLLILVVLYIVYLDVRIRIESAYQQGQKDAYKEMIHYE